MNENAAVSKMIYDGLKILAKWNKENTKDIVDVRENISVMLAVYHSGLSCFDLPTLDFFD